MYKFAHVWLCVSILRLTFLRNLKSWLSTVTHTQCFILWSFMASWIWSSFGVLVINVKTTQNWRNLIWIGFKTTRVLRQALSFVHAEKRFFSHVQSRKMSPDSESQASRKRQRRAIVHAWITRLSICAMWSANSRQSKPTGEQQMKYLLRASTICRIFVYLVAWGVCTTLFRLAAFS